MLRKIKTAKRVRKQIDPLVRRRRFSSVFLIVALLLAFSLAELIGQQQHTEVEFGAQREVTQDNGQPLAIEALEELKIKGRAPKTDYSREQFSTGWDELGGCDTRNLILARDLTNTVVGDDGCTVLSGDLHDPYTDRKSKLIRAENSRDIHIEHIVAVSDAWVKGAQQLEQERRREFYHDPLNLLVVEGSVNIQKGNADAASWLPPNKPFRCQFIARQVAVKTKYTLWVTLAERDAMERILLSCPDQRLPAP